MTELQYGVGYTNTSAQYKLHMEYTIHTKSKLKCVFGTD